MTTPLPACGERRLAKRAGEGASPEQLRIGGIHAGRANIRVTARARRLRHDLTDAERKLWYRLNNRQLAGWKFVRQEPIGPYFADFACREARLVVEVDGSQHVESERDKVRDAFLAARGYRVLRFWNNDVLRNTDSVLETIFAALGGENTSHRKREEATGEASG